MLVIMSVPSRFISADGHCNNPVELSPNCPLDAKQASSIKAAAKHNTLSFSISKLYLFRAFHSLVPGLLYNVLVRFLRSPLRNKHVTTELP